MNTLLAMIPSRSVNPATSCAAVAEGFAATMPRFVPWREHWRQAMERIVARDDGRTTGRHRAGRWIRGDICAVVTRESFAHEGRHFRQGRSAPCPGDGYWRYGSHALGIGRRMVP